MKRLSLTTAKRWLACLIFAKLFIYLPDTNIIPEIHAEKDSRMWHSKMFNKIRFGRMQHEKFSFTVRVRGYPLHPRGK